MTDNFKCLKCNSLDLEKSEIIELKCKHIFCWSCIKSYVRENINCKIICPLCEASISDSIIREILNKNEIVDYEKHCLASVVKSHENCFQCLLPECGSIVFFDDKETQFECQNCSLFNCISCVGSHPYISCKEFQKLKQESFKNKDKSILERIQKKEYDKARLILQTKGRDKYLAELKEMESLNYIPNDEPFSCSICLKEIGKSKGIKLRNCEHTFCHYCIRNSIRNTSSIPAVCLEASCQAKIDDREVKEILSDQEFEIYNDKSLSFAISKLENIFHCKKPDCKFFGTLGPTRIASFQCPSCQSINCVECKVIHGKSESCIDYQKSLEDKIDLKSLRYIENEIHEGSCMTCRCGCIINKNGGCNWIKCPQCKLELCWILKIPRWGPKGKGDISGGCKCGVNNKPCHESCLYGCIPDD